MDDQEQSVAAPKENRAGAWPWSLLLGMSIAWLGCAVIGFSHVQIEMLWFLGLAFFGGLIALVWSVSTLLELFARVRARPEWLELSRRRLIAWAATPTMGLIGLGLAFTDIDLHLRVQMSSAALAERAQEVLDSGSTDSISIHDRIGLFSVSSARANENGSVQFFMQTPWIFTETGLIFDPDGAVDIGQHGQTETRRIDQTWVSFVWTD